MSSWLYRLAAIMGTVLALGACSSSSPMAPIDNLSVAALVGRFALDEPTANGSGIVIVADTLVLAADGAATRYLHYEAESGSIYPQENRGTYEVTGSSVIVRYHSIGGGYGFTEVVTMTAMGWSQRVTRLNAEYPGWQATYDRVGSR